MLILLAGCTPGDEISKVKNLEKELDSINKELSVQKQDNIKLQLLLEGLKTQINELELQVNSDKAIIKDITERHDVEDYGIDVVL